MAVESRPQTNAVAIIQPPRLPYPKSVEQDYGVTAGAWKALVESVFPNAKSAAAVDLALAYCKARKLDVFKRVVHIVPIYDSVQKKEVESVWPGIAEHRTTAMRTGTYAGLDEPRFGPMKTKTFSGNVGSDDYPKMMTVDVTFPEWCEITLYRMVQGARVPFPGPRVYWLEYFSQRRKSGVPNDRWCRAPSGQLEKCAEAGALRRAFPEELGEEWSAEEIGGAATMHDITPPSVESPPPEPTREQFKEPARPATDVVEELSTDVTNGWPKLPKNVDFAAWSNRFLDDATPDQAKEWEENYRGQLAYMAKGTATAKRMAEELMTRFNEIVAGAPEEEPPASDDDIFPGDLPSKVA